MWPTAMGYFKEIASWRLEDSNGIDDIKTLIKEAYKTILVEQWY